MKKLITLSILCGGWLLAETPHIKDIQINELKMELAEAKFQLAQAKLEEAKWAYKDAQAEIARVKLALCKQAGGTKGTVEECIYTPNEVRLRIAEK